MFEFPRYSNYVVHKTYSIEEVLEHVNGEAKHEFDGVVAKVNSLRLRLYKEKGTACCHCGRVGTFFRLEHQRANVGQHHFNLYGKDEDGTLFMMTQDHIIPKSKGGRNHLDNLQPLCDDCNTAKKDDLQNS